MRIQICHVPDCPLTERLMARVAAALQQCQIQAEVEEFEGDLPSPTLLIDGKDVQEGLVEPGIACRLELPTQEQIVAALSVRAQYSQTS